MFVRLLHRVKHIKKRQAIESIAWRRAMYLLAPVPQRQKSANGFVRNSSGPLLALKTVTLASYWCTRSAHRQTLRVFPPSCQWSRVALASRPSSRWECA